jgi:hypothetical protein
MKIKSAVLVGLGALGLSLCFANSSEAMNPIPDACATATANATLTVNGSNVQSTSPDISYVNSACRGYIVDVKFASLPGNSAFTLGGGLATNPGGQLGCELANEHVGFYKKAAGAATFTPSGGEYRKGYWTGNNFPVNTCSIRAVGAAMQTPAIKVGDTWRVVVRGVEAAEPARVQVTGGVIGIPQ